MGVYIYKLNGKVVTANAPDGTKVAIALAPYFTKPDRETWQWLDAIGAFPEKPDPWLDETAKKNARQYEQESAGIYKSMYSYKWQFDEAKKRYYRFKRRIYNAQKILKNFQERKIVHVIFADNLKWLQDNPDKLIEVYQLNESYWYDEPNFGTPQQGKLTLNNGKLTYTPII